MVQVFLGGMFGTLLRYIIYLNVSSLTMLWIVNIGGSVLLGFLNGAYEKKLLNRYKLFWTTGVLGSFTTFASFSEQWFHLIKESIVYGMLFGISMTLLCVFASFVGYQVTR